MEDVIEDMIFGNEETLRELLEKQAKGELEEGFDFDFPRYSEIFDTGFRWDVPYKVVDLDKFKETIKEAYGRNYYSYAADGYLIFKSNIYCCTHSKPILGLIVWGENGGYRDCLFNDEGTTLDEYEGIMKKLVSTLGEVDKEALNDKIKGHEDVIREQTSYLNILRSLY